MQSGVDKFLTCLLCNKYGLDVLTAPDTRIDHLELRHV